MLNRGEEDDACVYLGPQKECLIHAHFGESVKPLLCRLYPFGFVPVGKSMAVDVSFACRGVVEERGAPLAEQVPDWVRLAGEAAAKSTEHLFSKKLRIGGELLWELEHPILELLSDRSVTMPQRIREVAQFVKLGVSGDPTTDAARKLREVMLTGVPKQLRGSKSGPLTLEMDKTQRAVFFQLLYVSLNPTPDAFHDLRGKARAKELERRLRASERYRSATARPWVDNRELDTTFEDVPAIGSGFLAEDAGERLIERYLAAKITGQRFLAEGDGFSPFVLAVHRLLLLYPMALWTAKALAADAGKGAVTAEETRRALRLIDRSYGGVPLSDLPSKQRKAWEFVLLETDLEVAATAEMSERSDRTA